MKILKVSGIVAGIHLLALIIIFVNPGCSSSTKQPQPADTVVKSDAASPIVAAVPASTATDTTSTSSSDSSNHISFNPAAATPRYSPTRPNTAVASALQVENVDTSTPASTYVVVSRDTLSGIAKKNHLTTKELAAANNLKADATIRPGQKLIIPSKPLPASDAAATTSALPGTASTATTSTATAKTSSTSAKPSEGIPHTVKPGETLGTIAKHYGVKQADIIMKNNITDPQKIRAGDKLIIPGWDQPAGKNSSKSSSSTASDVAKRSPEPQPAYPSTIDTSPKPAPLPEVPVIKVEDAPASKP